MTLTAVSLSPLPHTPGPLVRRVASSSPVDVDSALRVAVVLGGLASPPGGDGTVDLWGALATVAASDLGAARAIEPHLDALAILIQGGRDRASIVEEGSTWGVFAAEGGDDPLTATRVGDGWSLTGTKPWCSLADRLDRALVSAHLVDGQRALFAINLHAHGVLVPGGGWHARGLSEIPSGPVTFLDVPATAIGEPGWYLSRPGFAWGGIGVSACWFGGAVGIARTVYTELGATPAPLAAAHLGAIDEQLNSARRALHEAAQLIDRQATITPNVLAKQVRATVAATCESVLRHSAHALGPAPLALNAEHAKRVADLEMYIRQHHAERDYASLGTAIAKEGIAPW